MVVRETERATLPDKSSCVTHTHFNHTDLLPSLIIIFIRTIGPPRLTHQRKWKGQTEIDMIALYTGEIRPNVPVLLKKESRS